MADKTIPELVALTSIDENALFIVDTGTETFKITSENIAVFFRDSILPAGMTSPYAGATAPSGWLLADGSAVSRTTYARLFTAIGAVYGIGDGLSTFNLPDLRGRVVAGKDNMGGTAASRITTAISGFDGLTLGAAGGSEYFVSAGTISGSQSISHLHAMPHAHSMAHTHTMSNHTHQFHHVHIWANASTTSFTGWYTLLSPQPSKTTINITDHNILGGGYNQGTGPASSGAIQIADPSADYHTTGVLGAPSGTGSTASTSDPNTPNTSQPSDASTGSPNNTSTSGMSTNSTVNGSNFNYSGIEQHRVQATIILNYIIKT